MSRFHVRSPVLLTDTGPLVAMVNKRSAEHEQIVAILGKLPNLPLLTTWPCLTEAMYLLYRDCDHAAQDVLWGYVVDELLQLHDLSSDERRRMRELMKQYEDTPMDLADASLVATAESLKLRQIITLDSDFYIYRLADRSMLEVLR